MYNASDIGLNAQINIHVNDGWRSGNTLRQWNKHESQAKKKTKHSKAMLHKHVD